MKKLLFFFCFMTATIQVHAMDLSYPKYQKKRAQILHQLPADINRAQWPKLVSFIADGYITASDLINCAKEAINLKLSLSEGQSPTTAQSSDRYTLFQQLLSAIDRTNGTENPAKENQKTKLERALQALIKSSTIAHSDNLAESTPSLEVKKSLQIYEDAKAESENREGYISNQRNFMESIGHHIAYKQVDPYFVNHLTKEDKNRIAHAIIEWSVSNSKVDRNFLLTLATLINPDAELPFTPSSHFTLPEDPKWIVAIALVGLTATAAFVYKYFFAQSEATENEETQDDTERKAPQEQALA